MPDMKDRDPMIDQEGDRERRIDAMRPKDQQDSSCGCGSDVDLDRKEEERES
jgi:hypothetical protein